MRISMIDVSLAGALRGGVDCVKLSILAVRVPTKHVGPPHPRENSLSFIPWYS